RPPPLLFPLPPTPPTEKREGEEEKGEEEEKKKERGGGERCHRRSSVEPPHRWPRGRGAPSSQLEPSAHHAIVAAGSGAHAEVEAHQKLGVASTTTPLR
ncbi:unnamed protein product, partial [Urochloa humidicola]